MKKILIPTDFSPNAEKALTYAVQIAKKASAELLLIHAVESENMEQDIKDADSRLGLIKKTLLENEKFSIQTKIYYGSTENSILEATSENNIEMVIMGTLGNATLKGKLLGSKTASVIGKTTVPLFAIPLLSEWKVPKKILLAINRFDETGAQLQPVIDLARLFNASVQVTVFTDTDDDFVEDYQEHEVKIAAFRDLLKSKNKDLEIHAVHLASKHFKESLTQWIETNEIDIVVMLTHKKNFLEKIIEGSKTKKVSYYINIPLLAIPV